MERVSFERTQLSLRERSRLMHAISNRIDPDELRNRREVINRTTEYLRNERLGLEQNAPWMDAGAWRRRIGLLESLAAWYDKEAAKIDEAFQRLR
jgi:hypothetical protein